MLSPHMRRPVIALALVGVLSVPLATADVLLGTHAVRGRVRAVSATALVISRSAIDGRDMRFVLNPSTQREGHIVVGDAVSIRYVTQGETLIATAVASESRGCRAPGG
jgi:hypothetical protein